MGWRPGTALTGYLNEKRTDRKCQVLVDPERAPIIKQIFEKVANDQWSGRKVYHWLKFELNFKTHGNKNLSLGNLYRIIQNTFYYGVFEYPVGSGNFYQGKHEPLITKDVFDKVQEHLKRDHVNRETREFAFTKLLKCECGSGISACEKYKKLKDGTTSKYIYYGCTKSRNLNCHDGYIREEELIKQLVILIDQIDLNELGIKHKFQEEVKRYNAFQSRVLKIGEEKQIHEDINIKNYIKYLLKEGSMSEKREILSCIKSKIVIRKKILSIE